MSDWDTNIHNYSREELLEIIGANQTESKETINKKINSIIQKIDKTNDNNLLSFFENIKNILVNNYKSFKPKESQSEKWLQNQYLTPENSIQKDKLTNRDDAYQIFNASTHPIMQQEKLGISNTIPLSIGQGNLNPNLRQTITRTLIINSKQRSIVVPYGNNINTSTNFNCTLGFNLKNVVKMSLVSLSIPNTFNVFNNTTLNTVFWIKKGNYELNDNSYIQILIPSNNYNEETIIKVINEKLIANNCDYIELSYNNLSNKFSFINLTTSPITIKFYDNKLIPNITSNLGSNDISNNTCEGSNQIKNVKYLNSLGYYLGFRITESTFIKSNILLKSNKLKIPDLWPISIDPSGSVHAETTPRFYGTSYIKLLVDDYNKNQSCNNSISIVGEDNKLSLPKFFSKLSLEKHTDNSFNCYYDINTKSLKHQFVPKKNSELTINQLYALNEIINNRNSNVSQEMQNNKNEYILATLHLPFNTYSKPKPEILVLTKNDSVDTHFRHFFGPVAINKLKIALIDDNDDYLNLNGHDWSFIIKIDELYQY